MQSVAFLCAVRPAGSSEIRGLGRDEVRLPIDFQAPGQLG